MRTFEEDEEVDMREAPLLKLDGVDARSCTSEDPILEDLTKERLLLQVEDTCDQIRAISCRLPR